MSSDIKEMLQGEPNKGVRKKDKGGEEDMPLCDLGEAYRAEFRLVLQGALCVWGGRRILSLVKAPLLKILWLRTKNRGT